MCMTRASLVSIVLAALRDQLEADGTDTSGPLTEDTPLVGRNSPIDSLGLVGVIVGVEQRLQGEHGASVTLADDRAMSQRHSPFRTVGTLADYALAVSRGDGAGG
ncbi:MAG: acyl carrier protein [Chloroflexi bacterium]|nr:acyl carrier protein [Chloroflexota bacterium]